MANPINSLELLKHDEQTRQRYEARQKALHDYATAIETAKREGREEGKHQRAVQMARKMLRAGMEVRQVADVVELSLEEVEAIQREFPQDSRGAVSTPRTR